MSSDFASVICDKQKQIAVKGCGIIKSFGQTNCTKGDKVGFIAYISTGCAEVTVGIKTYDLAKGSLLTLQQDTPFIIKAKENTEVLWLELSSLPLFLSSKSIFKYASLDIEQAIRGIIRENAAYDDESIQLIDLYINQLLYMIKRLEKAEVNNVALACKEYLESNYKKQICNEELSQKFKISVNHLIFIFSKAYGMPPIKYLNSIRIETAKQLILSGVSIGDIAEEVGYKNIFYFSRVFKKQTGITPTEYKASKR